MTQTLDLSDARSTEALQIRMKYIKSVEDQLPRRLVKPKMSIHVHQWLISCLIVGEKLRNQTEMGGLIVRKYKHKKNNTTHSFTGNSIRALATTGDCTTGGNRQFSCNATRNQSESSEECQRQNHRLYHRVPTEEEGKN